MAMVGCSAGGLVYYLDKDSDNRVLWLIGSGLIISVWPWTLLAMMPDIKKLSKDDVIETAGTLKFHMMERVPKSPSDIVQMSNSVITETSMYKSDPRFAPNIIVKMGEIWGRNQSDKK